MVPFQLVPFLEQVIPWSEMYFFNHNLSTCTKVEDHRYVISTSLTEANKVRLQDFRLDFYVCWSLIAAHDCKFSALTQSWICPRLLNNHIWNYSCKIWDNLLILVVLRQVCRGAISNRQWECERRWTWQKHHHDILLHFLLLFYTKWHTQCLDDKQFHLGKVTVTSCVY